MRKTIHRISRMERAYDELCHALCHDPAALAAPGLQKHLAILVRYYEGGAWLSDYERDERGELPKDLKRGVLSEDGVYNLLSEIDPL